MIADDVQVGTVFWRLREKGKILNVTPYWVSGWIGPRSFSMSREDFNQWAKPAEIVRKGRNE